MVLDKAKTLRAAEKYLESGKIASAIKEYSQIVAVDADDFTALNMLGDLYTRVGNTAEAISCFHRIAEHYREQGFGLKAIAMYKKIDRLQPHDIEIATNLADLYAQQDLIVEARAHYLAVVDAHNRAGASQSALETLRKIADLDPQNTQIRTKLADGYLNLGLKREAAECFAEAGHVMVTRGACDEALEVFGRALVIQPDDYATLKGVLAAHSGRGTADEAAELIEEALKSNPEDRELLTLLADAYFEAEAPEQAERATASLVGSEPASYLRFTEVARLYVRHGKIAEAVSVVAKITEQMLAERQHQQLLELIDELLAGDADNVQALRLVARAHWWLRDMVGLKASLERLADAAQAQGLNDDERYALTQLTRLDPAQEEHVARLNELGGPIEEEAVEVLPEFEVVTEREPEPVGAAEEFVSNSQEFAAASDEAAFEWNPVAEVSEEPSAQADAEIETGFNFESIVAEEFPTTTSEAATNQPDEDDRVASMLRQELESVDFYIAQGYVDIAIDTLELLEQQCGSHPDIISRREQINQLQSGAVPETDAAPVIEYGEVSITNDADIAPSPEPVPEIALNVPVAAAPENGAEPAIMGIDAGLAEIFEEYRASSESEGEAAANGDYETHYNLGLAYKDMDLFEDALEEFQMAANLTSPADGTGRYLQCCNLLGHCFVQTGAPEVAVKWFAKGLSASHVSDEERMALTYEIAAAYEQAGDLHHALESFIEVYGNNVSYRNVNERVKTLKTRLGEKSTITPPVTRSEQLVN
ncbi:MAG TPA: tetratricopeptide repeat protein [Pyrinomonadaceae bacterium]